MGLKKEIVFYNEQLRRTSMISPISGEITTKDLDYLPGSYLKHGTTFAEVEDTRTVRIQIAVPESDIGEVKIGAKVSLRLWAYPNREFFAEVSAIQPAAAEKTTAGKMVTVTSQMDNPEGMLRSGLTGLRKDSRGGNDRRHCFHKGARPFRARGDLVLASLIRAR